MLITTHYHVSESKASEMYGLTLFTKEELILLTNQVNIRP